MSVYNSKNNYYYIYIYMCKLLYLYKPAINIWCFIVSVKKNGEFEILWASSVRSSSWATWAMSNSKAQRRRLGPPATCSFASANSLWASYRATTCPFHVFSYWCLVVSREWGNWDDGWLWIGSFPLFHPFPTFSTSKMFDASSFT